MDDLIYFEKKLKAGLRIPNSMLDVQGEQREQFSDMRVGQVYQVEIRYMGYIRRLASLLIKPLNENFRQFALRREVVVPSEVELQINPPMSFAAYKDMELNQTMLNVYNSTLQIQSLSKRIALEKYLNMETDDIIANEVEKLHEMGLSDEVIKTMLPEEISNIVYGDGRLGKEYGLPVAEEGAGGFGRF